MKAMGWPPVDYRDLTVITTGTATMLVEQEPYHGRPAVSLEKLEAGRIDLRVSA